MAPNTESVTLAHLAHSLALFRWTVLRHDRRLGVPALLSRRVVRQRWLPCAAIGSAAAAIHVFTATGTPTGLATLGSFVRAAAGAWLLIAVVRVGLAVIHGKSNVFGAETNGASLSHTYRAPWSVLKVAAILLFCALLRSPWRLAVNELGFALTAIPLVLAVRWRAGGVAATEAATALALFVLFPTHFNLPAPPARLVTADSSFRWSVGFPNQDWAIRHEIRLDRPLRDAPLDLNVQRAGPYRGQARVLVWLNDYPLGPLRDGEGDVLQTTLPSELVAGQTHLRLLIKPDRVDPGLRLAAQRWTGGATVPSASSYFDGLAWHAGTYDDRNGRQRSGLYVLDLRGQVWR